MAKSWGPWKNLEAAKEGGQGHVFKVQHESAGSIGALKRLKNRNRDDRFKNEIKAAKELQHPHIATLFDADESSEPEYVVFEWEEGGSLADIAQSQLSNFDIDLRLLWCEQIAQALSYAHNKKIIHRDIKPDNILLSKDRSTARLCDFGLVYFVDGDRVTATMEQVGSRFYIAPESESGNADDIGASTDLYSLGKLIYYLSSGGRMFARERQRDTQYDLQNVTGNPFVEHIATVIDRLVLEDRQARIQNADEVATLISRARRGIAERLPCRGVPSTYKCVFCKSGTYQFAAATKTDAHNNGYSDEGNVGNQYFAFYECPTYGNSQRFKVKYDPLWFPDLRPRELSPKTFQMRDGMTIRTS